MGLTRFHRYDVWRDRERERWTEGVGEEGRREGREVGSAWRHACWLLSCFEESTTQRTTGRDSAPDHCIHVQTQTDVEWLSKFLTHLGREWCVARRGARSIFFLRTRARAPLEPRGLGSSQLLDRTTDGIKRSPWASWARKRWARNKDLSYRLSYLIFPDEVRTFAAARRLFASVPSQTESVCLLLFPPIVEYISVPFSRVQRV